MTRGRAVWAFGIVVALLVAAAIVIARSDALGWRVQVVYLAATGKIPDVDTAEAFALVRPGSGFWDLSKLLESRNPYMSVANPRTSREDVAQGEQRFRSDCAACHGMNALGRETTPALVGRHYTHGDTDWSVYRTIVQGVPGTSMAPHPLPDGQAWQVVAYLRSLNAAAPDAATVATDAALARLKVDAAELAATPERDWLTYSGSYDGKRYSRLKQIDAGNVARIAPRWIYQFKESGGKLEVSPVVRDGFMFVTYAGSVRALDARNGAMLWEYTRPEPKDIRLCCGVVNRGVALLGDKVFVGTADARMLALSAATGKLVWEKALVDDYSRGYAINSPPLVLHDSIVTGIAGGDFPTRGFISALDAQTGQERWRFWTVPAKGEPGSETWAGDSARAGGGATWLTGAYDTRSDLVYWGVGNPAPSFNASLRRGDNLYTSSVVALNGTTGKLAWHFQFSPGDTFDFDSVQIPVLADRNDATSPRQLLWANRNGFFYVLDRQTGRFIRGTPFVRQTWAERLDDKGRPIRAANTEPSEKGTLIYPGVTGGTNWWSPSYDPQQDRFFVQALERGTQFFKDPKQAQPQPGVLYQGGGIGEMATDHYSVLALDPASGAKVWEHRVTPTTEGVFTPNGLLSTAGGLVFASDDKLFYALDSRDGKLLWSFPTGGNIWAAPMTYEADGRQYVAIASGRSLIVFGLNDQEGSSSTLNKK